jgi:Raf kinase inhibitor-like YbhB/YbcL family protein
LFDTESTKAVLVGIAVLAVACSSGDDGQADASASAGTAVPAGTTAVAEDGAASGFEEEYTLAQQFDLSINLISSTFNETKRIPRKYSCTDGDISPPMTWSDIPEGTVSIALLVDSDQHPGPRWVHWMLWGIPPAAGGLPEAVPNTPEATSIGPKARQGTNSEKMVGWSGPCPQPARVPFSSGRPSNTRDLVRQYSFKLFALDTEIELGPEATKVDLLRAIDGHILAGGELTGEQVGKIIRF